jgi:hypothetical protein
MSQALFNALRQRGRAFAWFWRAGQLGQVLSLLGLTCSILYSVLTLLITATGSGRTLAWTQFFIRTVSLVGGFLALLVLSVLLKSYIVKRAGLHDPSFGEEAE